MKFMKKIMTFVMVLCVAFVGFMGATTVKAAEVARFEFGEYDASKTNEGSQDGSSASSYTETVGDYTLTLSGLSSVYKGSYDAKGNSCLKLGASTKAGSFSFTVPNNIEKVVILVAGYKSNTAKITVNGISSTISKYSANGAYEEVVVATTSTKTVSFTTVSGGYRCKIDAIIFYTADTSTTPSISLTGNTDVMVNSPITLNAVVKNTESEVVWSSSNNEVATVEDGVVTAVEMGTATITAALADDETVFATLDITAYPNNENVITIAEAREICDFVQSVNSAFNYTIKGTINTINYAYSETYGNCTVTINDETGEIQLYYLNGGSELKVGDNLIVNGPLTLYSGKTYEVNRGTYVHDTQADVDAIESFMSMAFQYSFTEEEPVTYTSEFRIRFGAEKALATVANATEYGIEVTSNGVTKTYTASSEFWAEDDDCYYAVVSLGDVLNNTERLTAEFTVKAYVVVAGETYYSEATKTYSVKSMVEAYLGNAELDAEQQAAIAALADVIASLE